MKIDESRGHKYPFFPGYEFSFWFYENQKVISLRTTLRKQDGSGNWYFWDVIGRRYIDFGQSDEFNQNEILRAKKGFIEDCYKVIVLGVVDPNLIDSDGNPIFKRDPNQESETERLSRLANGK